MTYFLHNPALARTMGKQARRFTETRAPSPDEVYSTILK